MLEQGPLTVKTKLDSIMARLDQLQSEGGEGVVWDETEHERRVKLFE